MRWSRQRVNLAMPDPIALTTPDPRFDPTQPVTVNGYRYVPERGPVAQPDYDALGIDDPEGRN